MVKSKNNSKVVELSPNNKVSKEALLQLGSTDDLENFQIICHWKDGKTTCGWSSDLTQGQLIFGAALLQQATHNRVFGVDCEDF